MGLEKKEVFESKEELEQFRINWKNENTGEIVHGDFMDKKVVEANIKKLKKERPRTHYWMESESEATPLKEQN